MDMKPDAPAKENTPAKVAPQETDVTKTEENAKDTTEDNVQSPLESQLIRRKTGLHLFFLNIRYRRTCVVGAC